MPRVTFTANLQRHVQCPPMDVSAATLREALDAVFAANPRARGYVLDEQDELRPHMTIFVNGAPISDRVRLSDALAADDDVYVMQALSGG